MPRARALSVTRSYFEARFSRASRHPSLRGSFFRSRNVESIVADRPAISLPRRCEREIDRYLIAPLPGERPAESRRVCFLCQRPRIIDTSSVREPKKRRKKKKEREREGEKEKSFYRSTSRKRRFYNRHGHPRPYIPASRIVSRRKPHVQRMPLCTRYVHVHARW